MAAKDKEKTTDKTPSTTGPLHVHQERSLPVAFCSNLRWQAERNKAFEGQKLIAPFGRQHHRSFTLPAPNRLIKGCRTTLS